MKRSEIVPMPEFYDRYINLVEDISLDDALGISLKALNDLNLNELERIGDSTYAIGKWSVKEILQHLIDIERVLCYRALLIARNDNSTSPNFDENTASANAKANERNLIDIITELGILRKSTIALFKSFDKTALLRTGTSWKYRISVLGLGFCLVGHQAWHLQIIREKYIKLKADHYD